MAKSVSGAEQPDGQALAEKHSRLEAGESVAQERSSEKGAEESPSVLRGQLPGGVGRAERGK